MFGLLLLALFVQMPPGISRTSLVENGAVMCARLTYAPGAAETRHTHPFDAIVIQLTAGDVDMTIGTEHTRAHREPGFVWYVPRDTPHALANVGTAPIEQVTIAIKPDRASAEPGAVAAAPPGIVRTTILDNADARVVRADFSPSGREPVHEHPYDLVTVQLTPGTLEVRVGSKKETVRLEAGAVRFLPRNVPHAYASADRRPFTLLSVAIK